MKTSVRRTPPALAALLLLLPAGSLSAGLVRWTGAGGGDLWSDSGNWQGGAAPADGDDVVFGGSPAQTTSTVNLALTLNSFTFAADSALFTLRVAGSGPGALTFSGVGIQNLTGGNGPIRQDFFADAGAAGGTIRFTGSSGVNLGA